MSLFFTQKQALVTNTCGRWKVFTDLNVLIGKETVMISKQVNGKLVVIGMQNFCVQSIRLLIRSFRSMQMNVIARWAKKKDIQSRRAWGMTGFLKSVLKSSEVQGSWAKEKYAKALDWNVRAYDRDFSVETVCGFLCVIKPARII